MDKFLHLIIKVFQTNPWLNTVAISFGVAVLFYMAKTLVTSSLVKKKSSYEQKVKLRKKINQYFAYITLVFLVLIWFAQIQVFFVSIIAIAAAIVLAFKELIMCLTGGILIKASNAFNEGHRIEIENYRGFVIDKNLFTTKILEIGPERHSQQTTGDIIVIPNSMMLSKVFKNESYFKGYSIKSFFFKIDDIKKIDEFENALLEKAKEVSLPIVEEAKKGISKFCEKEGIVIPSVEPRTKVIVEGGKDFMVSVKLPVKNTMIADVEQDFNRFYLMWRLRWINE